MALAGRAFENSDAATYIVCKYNNMIVLLFVSVVTLGHSPKSQTIEQTFTTNPCQINPSGDLSPNKKNTLEAEEGRVRYGWVSGGWVGKEEMPLWQFN